MSRSFKCKFAIKVVIAILLIVIGAGVWAGGRIGLCPVTGIDMPATSSSLPSSG